MTVIEIDHARARARKNAGRAARASAPVVPQSVKGPVRRLKWAILYLTLSTYYMIPFLRWDRGPNAPDQAVLLDFANGRLYAFFIEIWPQDLYLVTGLLVLATVTLILANAIGGRVWCGFACPQTVWTDLFLVVERLIEGDRRQRLKNLDTPLTLRRAMQLGAKHAVWLLIALGTGGTLIFYFNDAPTLLRSLLRGQASVNALTWMLVFTGTTYGLAGFAREQVCTFMCPWPRLQGAIWDPEAFTVNYRDDRGEERMSAKRAAELRGRGEKGGDCVDCGLCVAVCPIGIDIREGPNFACINCGLCVDACDSVMSKLQRPRGLIDYETWRNIERGRRGEPRASRIVRPKTIVLTAGAVALVATMALMFANRTSGTLSVQHDRDPLSIKLADGSVRNAYTVKLFNKSAITHDYRLSIKGVDATMTIVGSGVERPISVPPDSSEQLRVTLTMAAPKDSDVRFVANDETGKLALAARNKFVGE
jgi:cytochrome c oxidase accessory protein FixG